MGDDAKSVEKMCALCGSDVSQRPRTKDKKGRYFCQPCFEKTKERLANRKEASAAPARAVSEAHDGIPLDEPDLSSVHEESSRPVGLREQAVCPQCDHPLTFDSVICTNCGFDRISKRATGATVVHAAADGDDLPTAVIKNGACGKCGYDLRKIKTMRCPECGSLNRFSSKRDEYAEDSRRAARMAYMKPAIYTVIGTIVTIIVLVMRDSSPEFLIANAIIYAVMYLLGLVVYFFCTITFVGVDEPFHLMALRLLAVFSIVNIVSALTDPIPSFMGRFGLVGTVHVLALMQIMEIDYEDAWIVALLTFAARVVVIMMAIWLLTK